MSKHYDTPEEWVKGDGCGAPFGRYIVRSIEDARGERWQYVVMFMHNGWPQAHGCGSSWIEAERTVLELINDRCADQIMMEGETVAEWRDD